MYFLLYGARARYRCAMFKFVVIYRRVDDEMALETFFSETHLPLMEQLPDLVASEISRVRGKPGGESRYHMVVENYFESADAFYAALRSAAGQQLMQHLKRWYDGGLLTWFYADSWREATADRPSQTG